MNIASIRRSPVTKAVIGLFIAANLVACGGKAREVGTEMTDPDGNPIVALNQDNQPILGRNGKEQKLMGGYHSRGGSATDVNFYKSAPQGFTADEAGRRDPIAATTRIDTTAPVLDQAGRFVANTVGAAAQGVNAFAAVKIANAEERKAAAAEKQASAAANGAYKSNYTITATGTGGSSSATGGSATAGAQAGAMASSSSKADATAVNKTDIDIKNQNQNHTDITVPVQPQDPNQCTDCWTPQPQ